MMQQRGGNQPPQAAAPGQPRPGPTSQMPQPQEKEGLKEAARVNIHIAMNMLEQALPVFGSETKEGKNVLRALTQLAKDFGQNDTSDLVPAEIRQMVSAMPQSGGGSEVQKMLMQQAMQGKQQQQPQQPPQGA
jgi:hypothetical protein